VYIPLETEDTEQELDYEHDRDAKLAGAGPAEVIGMLGSPLATLVADCAEVPLASELDEIDKSHFESDATFAGSLAQGLFSANASGRRIVVVEDFYRGKHCLGPSDQRILYGSAVRLRVGVSNFTGDIKLTLPFIAASAEVGSARAQYHLSVRGYKGTAIAELIPEPGDFDVQSYVGLIEKIAAIQKLITQDIDNVVPVRLGIEAPDNPQAVLRSSVGTVWALGQIADGRGLAEALRAFDWSSEASSAITSTYTSLQVGADERPHGDAIRTTQGLLGRLRLKT
jgi:hypothetical protein